jgi:hypothetical protein
MGRLLGWDEAARESRKRDYEREVAANLPAWEDIVQGPDG